VLTRDVEALANAASLDELYERVGPLSAMPGWNSSLPVMWPEPRRTLAPAHWSYREMKAGLDAAGRLIDTSIAERRNLVLINPAEARLATTRTLVAAYQMVLPGEVARSHRHTANALRIVIDAEPGTFTVVDGVGVPMEQGDVLLTPGMCWHGHANEGSAPAYWIDILDLPLVQLLEPMFYEDHPAAYEPVERHDPQSAFRLSRQKNFAALAAAFPDEMALSAPSLLTIGLFMSRLEPGQTTQPRQTTAQNVYVVLEGRGSSTIDGTVIDWERGDVFVAPGWRAHEHRADEFAVLLRATDAPVLEKLGFLRSHSSVRQGAPQ
jgi:gentisate 1,2-dioxygenase